MSYLWLLTISSILTISSSLTISSILTISSTHHFEYSLEKESLADSGGSREVQLVAERRCQHEVVQIYRETSMHVINRRKEGNGLFNDTFNTFYLRLYGVRHMVKDHSDSERGNPLPPHRLLFPNSSKGSFICIIQQTRQHIPQPLLYQ